MIVCLSKQKKKQHDFSPLSHHISIHRTCLHIHSHQHNYSCRLGLRVVVVGVVGGGILGCKGAPDWTNVLTYQVQMKQHGACSRVALQPQPDLQGV